MENSNDVQTIQTADMTTIEEFGNLVITMPDGSMYRIASKNGALEIMKTKDGPTNFTANIAMIPVTGNVVKVY